MCVSVPHWAGLPVLGFLFASLATSERRQCSAVAMASSPGSIRVRTTRVRRKTGMPIIVIRSQRCCADSDTADDVHTLCWPPITLSSHFIHCPISHPRELCRPHNRSSIIDTSDVFRNTLLAEATGNGHQLASLSLKDAPSKSRDTRPMRAKLAIEEEQVSDDQVVSIVCHIYIANAQIWRNVVKMRRSMEAKSSHRQHQTAETTAE